MTTEQNKDRYEDILKRIAERRPFGSKRREILPQRPQERVLDRINAYDCLADLARREYKHWLCYGPKSLSGSAWAGVVTWAHRKGYHGYQTLTLRGVWTSYDEDEIALSIGVKRLPYSAPVYDAGVYRVAIQNNFRIYYDDAGGPPEDGDSLPYRRVYDENERLQLRQALKDIVKQWRRELGGD